MNVCKPAPCHCPIPNLKMPSQNIFSLNIQYLDGNIKAVLNHLYKSSGILSRKVQPPTTVLHGSHADHQNPKNGSIVTNCSNKMLLKGILIKPMATDVAEGTAENENAPNR
jgi:hypothetical protein